MGFLCGVYESDPKVWALDGIPSVFGQEHLAPDIERLEAHLLRMMEPIPAFGEAGIKTVNNGSICYTPDGCPLLAPLRRYPGLWVAAGFAAGIGTGGGSGQFLADWMVGGAPPYDLPIVDPARFAGNTDRATCLKGIRQTYAKGYALPVSAAEPPHPRRSRHAKPGSIVRLTRRLRWRLFMWRRRQAADRYSRFPAGCFSVLK